MGDERAGFVGERSKSSYMGFLLFPCQRCRPGHVKLRRKGVTHPEVDGTLSVDSGRGQGHATEGDGCP